MKKTLLIICLAFLILTGCTNQTATMLEKVNYQDSYMIEWLEEYDATDGYTNHRLNAKEEAMFCEYITYLPQKLHRVFKDRVYAVFFVDGMRYGGLTTRVTIDDTEYAILFFNPETMHVSLNDWLSYRDNTLFTDADENNGFTTLCGSKYTGFLQTIIHETCHVYDYIYHVTPYTEDYQKADAPDNSLYYDVWRDMYTPLEKYENPIFNKTSFYGFGNTISVKEGGELLSYLEETPFSSLYGAKNWADDFAETITYYYLFKKYNIDYTVSYLYKGIETARYVWSLNTNIERWYPLCKHITTR